MAIKQLGVAESNDADIATKGYVDDAVAGAGGGGGIAIPFYIAGSLTTGTKTPEFIFPVACTLIDMKGRCNSGSSTTYRPAKNGSTTGTTSASTSTTVVSTTQSVSFSAGDRLALNVVAAGTGADLSVTFWATID